MLPDYSPLPDTISSVADEDTWMKMNRGFIADLDSLQITPARPHSFPRGDVTPVSLFLFFTLLYYFECLFANYLNLFQQAM